MRFRDRIGGFLFGQTSAVPLAVLRIAVGALTFAWAALLYADVDPLLTYLRTDPSGPVLWWQAVPALSTQGVQALCVLLVLFSALLTVGAWTGVSAWAVFLLTLAMQRYNPAAFNGGDLILRSVLQLGVALGPAGACLSLDARWSPARYRSQTEAWPLRFVQLHISLGYLLTAYLKARGQSWVDGTAMWYAFGLDELSRFALPTLLAAPPVGAFLTWGTMVTEAFVGIGVWWRRTLPAALMAGVLLHLGIALLFEISFFSLIMIVSYFAFIPSSAYKSPREWLNAVVTHGEKRQAPTHSVVSQ